MEESQSNFGHRMKIDHGEEPIGSKRCIMLCQYHGQAITMCTKISNYPITHTRVVLRSSLIHAINPRNNVLKVSDEIEA